MRGAGTLALGDLAPEESAQFLPVIEVQLKRNPVTGRFVEDRGSGLARQIHPGVTPDQPIAFVGESVTVPLSDTSHGIMQRTANRIDGVECIGVGEDRFWIDADG